GRVAGGGMGGVAGGSGRGVGGEVIRHKGASAVAAVDDAGRVTLIRQFRHAAGGYIWELPAGVLDHPGEAPDACAGRELLEETGLRAGRLTHLATILTTPGFTDERIHLFLAEDLREEHPAHEHDEVIAEVRRLPLPEALAMAPRGEIGDGKTICGGHRAAARLGMAP